MLYFRMEKMVVYLQKIGTEMIDEDTTYPYCKFVHILDPEDNTIEFWEASDDFFKNLIEPKTQIKKAGHKPDSVVPYH
jgi:hypothetical protein